MGTVKRRKQNNPLRQTDTNWVRPLVGAFVLCSLVMGELAAMELPDLAESVRGLRVPLQRHENGRVGAMLTAQEARMIEGGISGHGGIEVLLLRDDGITNGIARAREGIFLQNEKRAKCKGAVYLEKEGVTLVGTNMLWDAAAQEITVEQQPVLTLQRDAERGVLSHGKSEAVKSTKGESAAMTEKTVVRSDSLTFDYANFRASFLQNVRVKDSQFDAEADAMNVSFQQTNEIDRVDLAGHVRVRREDLQIVCGKGTYTRENGQILLEEEPIVSKAEHRVRGDKMSVWLTEERIMVAPRVEVESTGAIRRDEPVKSGGTGPIRVTADRLEFDYHEFCATFEGHVVVTEPTFSLRADRVLVFLENTNDVRRLDAAGHVRFERDGIVISCGKASYSRETGLIYLQENPVVTHGVGRIEARKMSVWIDQKRIVMEEGVRLRSRSQRGEGGGEATIQSDKLEFDYEQFIALFEKRAVVRHSEMTLEADRMRVFMANTNQLSRVDAVGHVHLKAGDLSKVSSEKGSASLGGRQFEMASDNMIAHFRGENEVDRVESDGSVNLVSGDTKGQCGRAIYWGKEGRVRMEGAPIVTKGENKLAAKVMSYYIQGSRVVIEDEVAGEIVPSSIEKGVE